MDLRKKEILLCPALFFWSATIACQAMQYKEISMVMFFLSMLLSETVGSLMLLLSIFSGQKIGIGDGLLLLAIGPFLGLWDTLILLVEALFLSSGYMVLGMLWKKWKRADQLPFVPFLFLASWLL